MGVDETFKLGRATLLVGTDVDPLKKGVLSASELVNGGPVDEELRLGLRDALGVKETGTEDVLTGTDDEAFAVGEKLPLLAVEDIVSE